MTPGATVDLTSEQIEKFHDRGFLVFPELLSTDEIDTLKAELTRLCELRCDEVVRERTGTPRMVFRTHDVKGPTTSEPFYNLARLPRWKRLSFHTAGQKS